MYVHCRVLLFPPFFPFPAPFPPSPSIRHPMYIDSVYSPSRWHTESFATDLPDYDCSLTLSTSTSRVDTDSDTNFLPIRQDDDDGGSTAFATPEGITPKSSDEEGEAKAANNTQTSSKVSEFTGGVASQFLSVSSYSGSLEVSGDSTSYLPSESGSQCTLTDSKEGGKTDSIEASKTDSRESGGKTGSRESSSNTARSKMPLSPHTEGSTQLQIDHCNGSVCSRGHGISSAGLIGSLTGQGGDDADLAGLTSHESSPAGVGRSITPHNGIVVGTDVYDGASLSSHSNISHYPDMPQHLLSINGTGPEEVVTSEPQANGHCRVALPEVQNRHIAKSQPVAVVTTSTELDESEESYSAGSGCYKEQQFEVGVVHALITQQDNKKLTTNLKQTRDSPSLSSRSPGSLFRIGLDSNSPSPAGMRRSPVGIIKQQQGFNPRGDSLSMGSPSPAPIFGVGRSPVSSIGTSTCTSDEQPLLLTRESVKAEKRLSSGGDGCSKAETPGPVDLQLRKQQTSPDVYHTPTTSKKPSLFQSALEVGSASKLALCFI